MEIFGAIQLSSIALVLIAAMVATFVTPRLSNVVPYGSIFIPPIAFSSASYHFVTTGHGWLFSACTLTIIADVWFTILMNREAYAMGAIMKDLAQKKHRQQLRRVSDKSELSQYERDELISLEAHASAPIVPVPSAIPDHLANWDIAITFIGWLLAMYAFASMPFLVRISSAQ